MHVRLTSVLVFSIALAASSTAGQGDNSVEVLQSHLSHGIGDSPFDSDVWRDEVNARLLLAARRGTTITDLKRIAPAAGDLEARIASLERRGFLRRDGTRVIGRIPIVAGADRTAYMKHVEEVAAAVDRETRGRWDDLFGALSSRGWSAWSYHFAWSQTMDSGFAWSAMMDRRLVPPLATLVAWVVHPPHPFKTGTNLYPDTELRDEMLAVTWRPGAVDTTGRLGPLWNPIWTAAVHRSPPPEARAELQRLGLLDRDGQVLVPRIVPEDDVYRQLAWLASGHVEQVARRLRLSRIRRLSGATDGVAFAMAYHDVSWELLGRFVRDGVIAVPPALQPSAPDAPLTGVCAIVATHPAFLRELRSALGIK